MAKTFYRQMPTLRDLPQQIPAPRAKDRTQKPQGMGKCLMQIPGSRAGEWLWQKLIAALSQILQPG